MTSYYEPKAGEWVQPIRRGYKLACCDCGLVHRMDFRIYKGRAQFRVWRHNRATAAKRKGLKTLLSIQKFTKQYGSALKRLAAR